MSASVEAVFAGHDILLGGVPSLTLAEFSSDELDKFNKYFDEFADQLRLISPQVASDFRAAKDAFLNVAKAFKAKIGNKPFGGIIPSPNEFGMQLLFPYAVKYDAAAPTAYANNSWKISVTAGTEVFILGSSTDFYRAKSDVGSRAVFMIMKNGLIEVGTSPKLNQFKVQTEKVNYAPWAVQPLVDQPFDRGVPLYRYNIPFHIPVWYDFGIKLSAMPVVSGTIELRPIGIVFYEYGFFSDLKYI